MQELLGNSTLTSFSDNKEKQCRSWCFFGEIGCGNGDDGCECEGGLIGGNLLILLKCRFNTCTEKSVLT